MYRDQFDDEDSLFADRTIDIFYPSNWCHKPYACTHWNRYPEEEQENEENYIVPDFQKIKLNGEDTSGVTLDDLKYVSKMLTKALQLRKTYMSSSFQSFPKIISRLLQNLEKKEFKGTRDDIKTTTPEVDGFKDTELAFLLSAQRLIEMKEGVAHVNNNKKIDTTEFVLNRPNRASFLEDYKCLLELINDSRLRSFCRTRLYYLSCKFNMHILLNTFKESAEQKNVPRRDFFNVIKVDTHVHAAGCINQNDLLKFINEKALSQDIVYCLNGKDKMLKEVFELYGIDVKQLSLDKLDVHADRHVFESFDNFNSKYKPVGNEILRNIFFKTDNKMKGKYFAEIFKEVTKKVEQSEYQKAEFRLSIYGRKRDEWRKLAKWAKVNEMNSKDVRWIIQVPRLYGDYKRREVANFQEFLANIFVPLFEATSDPTCSLNEDLHAFLGHVSGIDSVDDESKSEYSDFTDTSLPTPENWKDGNPPYVYYLYYMHANLAVLNEFRRRRRLPTFALRPHCGEAGNVTHLVAGFLFAENIAHGLTLNKVPALEYLYYLTQIGIAMSPMSNNALFLKYHANPLPEYFNRGLNVSLSTDDPMQFHLTKEPLIEEYSIAAQIWNLSSSDMCEIARNSVLQSGFKKPEKKNWLGQNYTKEGVAGNDVHKTNVPSIRVAYRYDTLVDELVCISRGYLSGRLACS